jgi:hypothetical protein
VAPTLMLMLKGLSATVASSPYRELPLSWPGCSSTATAAPALAAVVPMMLAVSSEALCGSCSSCGGLAVGAPHQPVSRTWVLPVP